MNKRQRKKNFKRWLWLETARYYEQPFHPVSIVDVGLGAWVDEIKRGIARSCGLPPHMVLGHRIDGYREAQLLLGWDGPK